MERGPVELTVRQDQDGLEAMSVVADSLFDVTSATLRSGSAIAADPVRSNRTSTVYR